MKLSDFAGRNPNCAILTEKPGTKGRRFFHKSIKPEFIDKILCGQKVTTHRRPTKGSRYPKDGDFLRFYIWSGKPYKSPQVWVCDVELRDDWEIGVEYYIASNGIFKDSPESAELVARQDGFESFNQMLAWFENQYNLKGIWLIETRIWRWAKIVAVNSQFLTPETNGNRNF